jgi:hypothetical protein
MRVRTRLKVALFTGCALGGATLVMPLGLERSSLRVPLWLLNLSSIVFTPGDLISYYAARENPWVAGLGNLVFYFLAGYLALAIWGRFRGSDVGRRRA